MRKFGEGGKWNKQESESGSESESGTWTGVAFVDGELVKAEYKIYW